MQETIDITETNQRIAPVDMDAESFRENGYMLIEMIAAFFESLPERDVTSGEQPKEIRAILGDNPIPAEGKPAEVLFRKAMNLLFEHSLFNGSPRFWGYITSSPAPAGILADLLAAAINPNVGANILSPMATEMERQCIRWIAELIGFNKNCGGLFVSGGNMANITGLLAARKAKANWNIRQTGLGHKKMLIYCSTGTHTWINKAADLLGFGTNNIRWINTNENEEMDTEMLEEQIQLDKEQGYFPFIVVGTAGSVSTGAIDPLEKIAFICKSHGLWFHVDGAYGAPAVIVPEVSHLFKGMELADSVALDPHKWLYSPLEAGCILVKNKETLQEAFSFHPGYYNFNGQDDDPPMNFHEAGFQNSRGFRALKVWITLQQAGKNGYRRMIQDDIKLSKHLFDMANAHSELQAVSHHLSIVTFRYIPDDYFNIDPVPYLNKLNEEIVNRIQAGGEVFLSNAIVDNKYCLRACIVNFRTQLKDIETLVEVVTRTGRAIRKEWKERELKIKYSNKPYY